MSLSYVHLSEPPTISAADGRSLSDQVYEYLVSQIIRGRIAYGERLNIKQIATNLNISAIPIRDAIKRLEQENLVVVLPRSHCYVRVPTKQAILSAISARRMIELFAVREVIPRVTAAELEDLQAIVDQMRPMAQDGRPDEDRNAITDYIELDRQFHTELCALSRNEYLVRFYREISMHLSMSFSYGIGVCHGIRATFVEHEAILAHLRNNSADAERVLEHHLLHSRENIVTEPRFRALPD